MSLIRGLKMLGNSTATWSLILGSFFLFVGLLGSVKIIQNKNIILIPNIPPLPRFALCLIGVALIIIGILGGIL
jgi:hypothetical protein